MVNDTVKKPASGFSLIEIMIALAVSLILLAGVFTIMSSSKKTYALQAELAKLQENARFAMEEIAYGVRMAGYAGCSSILPDNQASLTGNNRAIRSATKQNSGLYKLSNATGLGTSDVLSMAYLEDELNLAPDIKIVKGNDKLKDFLDFDDPVVQSTVDLIMAKQPTSARKLILSDCGRAKWFNLSGNNAQNARLMNAPVFNEPVEAFVSSSSTRYEVAKIDRTDGQESFGLFFSTDDTNFQLLVEGVREMRMTYGVDTGNSNNIRIANNPTGTVRSVRINLLMRTTERRFDLGYQGEKGKNLELGPFVFKPEEGYRYRLFSTLVQVRNNNG
jgi:type IV pilus assembly protein PilW